MKYAITLSSFRNIEALGQTLERISDLGYDAVEMYGEPEKEDVEKLTELFGSYQTAVCGITGVWGKTSEEAWKRKLLSSDAGIQRHAKNYVKKCINMCSLLGGKHLNVCLFADDGLSFFDMTHHTISTERKSKMHDVAIQVLTELAGFAKEHDVTIVLEPLNRYSTPYCNTAQDAMAIATKVDNNSLGIMLDTFHMNIEEDSFEHAILESKSLLRHMHFADNNRKMPGYGHIDFKKIVGALVEVNYRGYVTFEPTIQDINNYEISLKRGLELIKSMDKGT